VGMKSNDIEHEFEEKPIFLHMAATGYISGDSIVAEDNQIG